MTQTFIATLVVCFVLSDAALQGARFSSRAEKRGLAEDSSNEVPAEFLRLAEKWKQIYNGKEAAKFTALYTEDAQYLSAHVAGYIANGRDAVIANFQRGMDNGGALERLEVLSSNSSCDLAAVMCRYVAVNGGLRVEGRNLLVLKRSEGKWLIASHITVVRD